jgi:hypothetical protein
MEMIRFLFVACLGLIIFGNTAQAQSYPTCFNAQNIPVSYFPDQTIPDIAIAKNAPNGMPVVLWNPSVAANMHPATVEFFYYHECAHHALAHTLGNYFPGAEAQADCWAKKTMIGIGVLTPQKYQIVAQQLFQNSKPGMDWPNGAVRLQYLNNC